MRERAAELPGRRRPARRPARRKSRLAGFAVLAATALTAASAAAQVSDLVPPTFEFNFSNPGARSLGFGGAFAALADDATAAFANPAGLVQLTRPELSMEGRSWAYSTPYVTGGRIFGEPFGIGLDSSDGLRAGRSAETASGFSFLSVVFPRDRWSLAFYSHQLADFEFHGKLQGLYSGPWPGVTDIRRELDQVRSADFEVRSHAVAAAYRVSEALSVGLGLAHFDATLSALSESYGVVCGGPETPSCSADAIASFFDERPLTPDRLLASFHLAIDDAAWGLTGGFLWGFSERWKLGGFYRQGPELDFELEIRTGASFPGAPAGTVLGAGVEPVELPDVYGLGLSYRSAGDRLTLSFEWDRVEYANLTAGTDDERLVIDDGDELHLGTELVFPGRTAVLALRLGVWSDPAHSYRYEGGDYRASALLRGGNAELHVAAGLGVAFQRVQIDLGVDLSDPLDTVSASTVYRF